MRYFDTHCHFETTDPAQILSVLRRARAAGVERLTAVGGSCALNDAACAAARAAAAADPLTVPRVSLALGYDREQVHSPRPPVAAEDLAAWGEIGLDYHYAPETRKAQCALFAGQLDEARRRGLPVVIHTREADDDTLAILREVPSRGIIHCFTGTRAFARPLLDLGLYVSISGIVTFRAAENVRETARYIPDDRILVETDAPFLAPVPKRGQPNEPAFLPLTAAFLADLRKTPPDVFADLVFANAETVFSRELFS